MSCSTVRATLLNGGQRTSLEENCRWKIKVLVAMNEFPCATDMLFLLVAKCSHDGANGFLNAMPMELKSEGISGE